jgi:hypothetical protein
MKKLILISDKAVAECNTKYHVRSAQREADQLALDQALKDQRKEMLDFAKQCLDLARHGDYSNGVEYFGLDEGRELASGLLVHLEARLKVLEGSTT